jgi:hypothetical protein
MTQDRARKAAVRARMAETGESYTEAARQLAKPVTVQAILDTVAARLGIPDDALSVVMRHLRETREYPLLAAGAREAPRGDAPGRHGGSQQAVCRLDVRG